MANDMFGRSELNYGGGFPANLGIVVADPASGLTGVLMTQIQSQYNQQLSKVYDLGVSGLPSNFYMVEGRSQGTLNTGGVLGPKLGQAAFFTIFGDVCRIANNNVRLRMDGAGCGAVKDAAATAAGNRVYNKGGRLDVTAQKCVISSFGFSVQSENYMINTQTALMFQNMEYKETGAG